MGNMRVEHHRSASRCIVAPYFNYPDLQKHFIICCWTFHILPIDLWICKFQYSFCKCLMAWEERVWDDLRKLVESSALVEDRKQVKRAKRRGVSCIHCTVHSQKKNTQNRLVGIGIWTPYSWQYGQSLPSLWKKIRIKNQYNTRAYRSWMKKKN